MATTIIEPLQAWANNHPSTATAASCSLSALANDAQSRGQRWVCTTIVGTIANAAATSGPLQLVLRDGATGSGTIIFSAGLSALANGSGAIMLDGLQIRGSLNTAMTLEFTGAGGTGSQQDVTLGAYCESAVGP